MDLEETETGRVDTNNQNKLIANESELQSPAEPAIPAGKSRPDFGPNSAELKQKQN